MFGLIGHVFQESFAAGIHDQLQETTRRFQVFRNLLAEGVNCAAVFGALRYCVLMMFKCLKAALWWFFGGFSGGCAMVASVASQGFMVLFQKYNTKSLGFWDINPQMPRAMISCEKCEDLLGVLFGAKRFLISNRRLVS